MCREHLWNTIYKLQTYSNYTPQSPHPKPPPPIMVFRVSRVLLHCRLVVDWCANFIESLTELWHEELWLVDVKPHDEALMVGLVILEGSLLSSPSMLGGWYQGWSSDVCWIVVGFFLPHRDWKCQRRHSMAGMAKKVQKDHHLQLKWWWLAPDRRRRSELIVNGSFGRQYGGFLSWLGRKLGGKGVVGRQGWYLDWWVPGRQSRYGFRFRSWLFASMDLWWPWRRAVAPWPCDVCESEVQLTPVSRWVLNYLQS